jgi:hypothetical protein
MGSRANWRYIQYNRNLYSAFPQNRAQSATLFLKIHLKQIGLELTLECNNAFGVPDVRRKAIISVDLNP